MVRARESEEAEGGKGKRREGGREGKREKERETVLVSVVDSICGETKCGREKMLWRKSDILLCFIFKSESVFIIKNSPLRFTRDFKSE